MDVHFVRRIGCETDISYWAWKMISTVIQHIQTLLVDARCHYNVVIKSVGQYIFQVIYVRQAFTSHVDVHALCTQFIQPKSTLATSTGRLLHASATRVNVVNLSLRRTDELQLTIVDCLIKVRRAWQNGREWRVGETQRNCVPLTATASFIHRAHRVYNALIHNKIWIRSFLSCFRFVLVGTSSHVWRICVVCGVKAESWVAVFFLQIALFTV